MTTYEIITLLFGVIGLLMSSCSLLIALLTYIDKKK